MSLTKRESLQRAIRQECVNVVGSDFLRSLHEKSAYNFLLTVLHLWLSLLAAFAVAVVAFQVSTILLLIFWLPLALFIATRINALNVQVHEGSHGLLANSRLINNLLCNWLAAYPTLYDVDQYGAVHTHHHQHLNEAGDPELSYYHLPSSRLVLLGCFLQDFFWITLVRRMFTIKRALSNNTRISKQKMFGHILGRLLCMAIMIIALHVVLGWKMALLFYLFFWLVPLFSFYPMLIRLRQVAEHYAPTTTTGESVFVARTTSTRAVEHYFLGAQMEYHFEHHLFPLIPYKNLSLLHRHLQEIGFFQTSQQARPEHSLSDGYVHFWRQAVLTHTAFKKP